MSTETVILDATNGAYVSMSYHLSLFSPGRITVTDVAPSSVTGRTRSASPEIIKLCRL